MKNSIDPEKPFSLVIFVDENQEIVKVQGHDISNLTQSDLKKLIQESPICYYFPVPDSADEEEE